MAVIFLGDDNKTVERIFYDTSELTIEDMKGSISIDSIPQAENIPYKVARLIYEDGVLSYEYFDRPLTTEEEYTIRISEVEETLATLLLM
ncbi:hypothetical protein JNUCC23_02020 [Peribacillus sp. JNUCC 23]